MTGLPQRSGTAIWGSERDLALARFDRRSDQDRHGVTALTVRHFGVTPQSPPRGGSAGPIGQQVRLDPLKAIADMNPLHVTDGGHIARF